MDGNHIEPDSQKLRLIVCPHILSIEKDRIDRYVPEGATVTGHLRALGWQPDSLNARVFIDGEYIEQAQWEYAMPKAGQSLIVRAVPMGGGGGGGQGKDAMRIVAMIAVVVASVMTAGGALAGVAGYVGGAGAWAGMVGGSVGAAAAGAAVSIIGTLAINGLIPAPLPRRTLPQPMPQRALQEAA